MIFNVLKVIMRISILLFALVFLLFEGNAQEKKSTHKGRISFEASIPTFEDIKAVNEATSCILNLDNGEITSLAIVKEFCFKLALMKEHFNSNYLESTQYPKAQFKGKIIGFNWNIIGDKSMEFKLIGKLELHGKTKKIETIAHLKKIDNALEMTTDFNIDSSDFNIVIPAIISSKISKIISIKTMFLLN